MAKFNAKELGEILQVSSELPEGTEYEICYDTRLLTPNSVFIPIKGEEFDRHEYIEYALTNSNGISICEIEFFNANLILAQYQERLLLVEDVNKAFFSLMREWRSRFPHLKSIAIGGSTGKTTTKELLRYILELQGNLIFTKENFNTPLGQCFTINQLTNDTEYLLCEMGIDRIGEMDLELSLVVPQLVATTNITATHAEFMGNSIEAVAEEECKLLKYGIQKGFTVVNLDDNFTKVYANGLKNGQTISLTDHSANLYLKSHKYTTQGAEVILSDGSTFKVPLWGKGNLNNLLIVISLARELGCEDKLIQQGLDKYQPVGKRLRITSRDGGLLIEDAYNANTLSMFQAFDVAQFFATQRDHPKPKAFILGDMRELGKYAEGEHTKLAQALNEIKPEILIYFGKYGALIKSHLTYTPTWLCFENYIDTANVNKVVNLDEIKLYTEQILKILPKDAVVLVKGSKGTGLWKLDLNI